MELYIPALKSMSFSDFEIHRGVLFSSGNIHSAVVSIKEAAGHFRHDWPIWNALSHAVNRSLHTKQLNTDIGMLRNGEGGCFGWNTIIL